MTDDHAVNRIHRILDEHGQKLSDIQRTLQQIAVQDEQIRTLQEDIREQKQQIDTIQGPTGCIAEIRNFQASCPRQQIKYLWWVVVPMSLTQVGLFLMTVKIMVG